MWTCKACNTTNPETAMTCQSCAEARSPVGLSANTSYGGSSSAAHASTNKAPRLYFSTAPSADMLTGVAYTFLVLGVVLAIISIAGAVRMRVPFLMMLTEGLPVFLGFVAVFAVLSGLSAIVRNTYAAREIQEAIYNTLHEPPNNPGL